MVSPSRAQAAIFDGILFLLIASVSVAMMFVFVNQYGVEQDNAIRSSHMLNYVESAVKEIYYLRVDTLARVTDDGYSTHAPGVLTGASRNAYKDPTHAYYKLDDAAFGCPLLAKYSGPITVADLMKRDLGDGQFDNRQSSAHIDPVTGELPAGGATPPPSALQPGLLAFRCALKEIMKPFTTGGFRYYAEVLRPALYDPAASSGQINQRSLSTYVTSHATLDGVFPAVNQADPAKSVATDSRLAIGANPRYRSCDDVSDNTPTRTGVAGGTSGAAGGTQNNQNFVVAVPFRVIRTDVPPSAATNTETYTLRVCIFTADAQHE